MEHEWAMRFFLERENHNSYIILQCSAGLFADASSSS